MRQSESLLGYTVFPEPSTKVAFAGAVAGRSSEKRHADSVSSALSNPHTQIALFGFKSDVLLRSGKTLSPFQTINDAHKSLIDPSQTVLLGHKADGAPLLVARTKMANEDDIPQGFDAKGLRMLYMEEEVSSEDLANLGYGHALLSWHGACQYCGRCGGTTQSTDGGAKRICDTCNAEHFPRTDPVAIMLITHDDKCLLGRTPNFIEGMYSCLAGFVEQGETLEEAVRRETLEEAGVVVGKVAYHSSQPWPFPHSLMLGCMGEALDPKITVDYDEMEDCAWFTREDVRLMLAGQHPSGKLIPPGGAIATHIIRAWLDES